MASRVASATATLTDTRVRGSVDTRRGEWQLSGVKETQEPSSSGATVVGITRSGPVSGIANAVAAGLEAEASHPSDLPNGTKGVLVRSGANMLGGTVVSAIEGRVVHTPDGRSFFMKKNARSRGYPVTRDMKVLPGATVAQLNDHPVVADQPAVRELTQADLESATRQNPVVMYGNYRLMGQDNPGSIYIIDGYMPGEDGEDGIVEGIVIFPEGSSGYSESGSIYQSQMERMSMGVVEGARLPESPMRVLDGAEPAAFRAALNGR